VRRTPALFGLAATATAAALVLGPAAAAAPTISDPLADGMSGPLQFHIGGPKHRPHVAQAFNEGPGLISKVKKNGKLVDAVVDENGSITGVAMRGKKIAYTLSGGFPEEPLARNFRSQVRGAAEGPFTLLKVQNAKGKQRVVGDLGRFENRVNPDSKFAYGFLGLDPQCQEEAGPFGTYAGIRESNPYAVAAAPGGGWYVADAAANTILKVKDGKVRLVHVLSAQRQRVTAALQEAFPEFVPECAIGSTYAFEGVPTDVEVGDDGMLYVSSLPGGPEGPEGGLPARGRVLQVNPKTGQETLVARGFAGATNLAVAGNKIWVTELFGPGVSQINLKNGKVRQPFVEVPLAAGLEAHNGKVFVTYDVFGPDGKLARIIP
jgi:hypothetical protein